MASDRSGGTTDEPMAKPTRSLVDHTADVVTAFVALFGTEEAPNQFASRWLKFFKVSAGGHGVILARMASWRVGSTTGGRRTPASRRCSSRNQAQAVRHEVISALIMMQPQVWRWLEAIAEVDLPLVLAAVAGHHLKAAEPGSSGRTREFGTQQLGSLDVEFTLTWNHPKIREQLEELAKRFGIEAELPGRVPEVWVDQEIQARNT